jgi:putative transcriptional regulator
LIRFRLAELMARHSYEMGRRVEWLEVSSKTGVHRSTLSKMLNSPGYNTTTDTIDALCTFFGCPVEDLMVHVPADGQTPRAGEPPRRGGA